ncbi:hypothetical protein QVH35_08320 [Candidatus Nitrosotenuis chungbukensis]|uniref:hypothetical protein n=1 Tax=Candidatus Nitrosotenuis chungbukensis TaxID=1353246 RepID=UPI0005B27AA7|nr:hypothetical protein [Candidatus Nitrosotenuis chungbukensis]WKT57397.1 hypothetical protein QVH35_08320 [Candidatus Nitrosotenuis chungbukensis]
MGIFVSFEIWDTDFGKSVITQRILNEVTSKNWSIRPSGIGMSINSEFFPSDDGAALDIFATHRG